MRKISIQISIFEKIKTAVKGQKENLNSTAVREANDFKILKT